MIVTFGVVADDADGAPGHAREADDDVLREVLVHLHEVACVDDAVDDLAHGVGPGGGSGGSSALVRGRKERSRRTSCKPSSSPSMAKWQTPLRVAWAMAPPNSSWVTSSPVTALITSGPVIYIWAWPF